MEHFTGDDEKENHEGLPNKACKNSYYLPGIPKNIGKREEWLFQKKSVENYSGELVEDVNVL
jgi:hypothetical protein